MKKVGEEAKKAVVAAYHDVERVAEHYEKEFNEKVDAVEHEASRDINDGIRVVDRDAKKAFHEAKKVAK